METLEFGRKVKDDIGVSPFLVVAGSFPECQRGPWSIMYGIYVGYTGYEALASDSGYANVYRVDRLPVVRYIHWQIIIFTVTPYHLHQKSWKAHSSPRKSGLVTC